MAALRPVAAVPWGFSTTTMPFEASYPARMSRVPSELGAKATTSSIGPG